MPGLPLCVDLDGTLLRTDLLHEAVFRLFKQSPLSLLLIPFWLLKGKAYLKEQLAQCIDLDPVLLPYNETLLAYLRAEKESGRELVLVTASPKSFAESVSRYTGLFNSVFATEGGLNLSGRSKANRLCELFGERGFEYAGNSRADLMVWQRAASAILVDVPSVVARDAARLCPISKEFRSKGPQLGIYIKALRLHQWLKNVLVFLPLLTAHKLMDPVLMASAALAFLAFGFCASSVYVFNDLLDLPSDRAHPRKRERPFAAGTLPLLQGAMMIPILLFLAILASWSLPREFLLVLGGYYLTTLAYSLWIKNRITVDVITLAALYTFRIIAGEAATWIRPSFWLLAFSMFLFLSLALIKRYSELMVVLREDKRTLSGRGYLVGDLPILMGMGCASAQLSVLVMALYVNSPDVNRLYANPRGLWLTLPLLLFWISRMWMKTHRGEMHDDPVVFAMQDWVSLVTVALTLAVIAVATQQWGV
jgi:4-hydroxybenzoate polyprenyltransferase/phosphoserine phosphatase